MSRSRRPSTATHRHEQLIAALLPDANDRPPPRSPARLPTLPAPGLSTLAGTDGLLVGMARIDRSGRLHERTLFRELGWAPGHRLDLDVVHGLIIVTPAPAGRHVLDNRGALPLPASARRMCGITLGPPAILAAAPAQNVLAIHPAATLTRILAAQYAELIGTPDEQ